MYYKKSAGEKVCTGLIYIFCIVLTLAFLYPVVYCLSMSISDAEMLGGQPIGMFQRIIMDVDSSENFEEMVDILPIEVRGGCYLTVVILEETALPDMDRRINDVFGGDIVSVFKRHKDEYVLILYQQQENFREEVRERCGVLLRQTDVLIGVGKTYPDIYGIGRSYHDALRALDNRRADAEEAVVWDAEAMGESARYRIPSNAESVLYNYLVSGNSGLVRETIAQSLEKNRKSGIGFREYLQLIGV